MSTNSVTWVPENYLLPKRPAKGWGMRLGFILVMFMVPLLYCAEEKTPKLTGIVYWQNEARALLELPSNRGVPTRPILREGDAVGGYSVKRIDAESGTVELLQRDGDGHILDLGIPPGERTPGRTIQLHGADLRQVLEVYQQLSGRTVIGSAAMTIVKIDCKSDADLSRELAVGILTNSLRKAGIIITPITEKFAVAGTEHDDKRVKSLKQPPPSNVPGEEIFPPGLIKFQEADSTQVLEIHAELTGRRVTPPERARPTKVTVRSQTPLNRREAAWVLEASLYMGGMPVWSERTN